jgi:O-antigen/teichoic acid export membrane protein
MTSGTDAKHSALFNLKWQSPLDISRTHNVLWNGASRLAQVGLQFLFVPVYIHILGPVSYGLVVLSATLMAAFAFLDHVTNTTVTRAFGVLNGVAPRSPDMWKILSRLERYSFGLALVIAVCVPLTGFHLTRHWTRADGLEEATLWSALALMGAVLAMQFMGTLYAAGLMGLQRQKLVSVIRVLWAPAYYGIGAALLFVVERSVIVLFAWQIMAFLLLALVLRFALHRTMPALSHAQGSSYDVLKEIRRFGAGSLLVALSGAAVSQIDKFMVAVVSQPMQFAAYGLAFSVVMQAMTLATGPFATAMYPHFAQLIADRNETALKDSYHRWAQVVVAVSALGGGALVLLGPLLVDVWLGAGSTLAPDIKRLLPVVVMAWVLHGALATPFMLAMASGRLHLIYGFNIAAILAAALFLPAALAKWGFEAGAFYLLAVNLACCLIVIPLQHRTLLKGEGAKWALRDTALPLLVSGAVFYVALRLMPPGTAPVTNVLYAAASLSVCFILLLAVMPEARDQILKSLQFLRRGSSL